MQIILKTKKGDKNLDSKKLFLTGLIYMLIAAVLIGLVFIGAFIKNYTEDAKIKQERIMTQKLLDTITKGEFSLDKNCPLPNKYHINYIIYGNGSLKLDQRFESSDFEKADLIIFHGSNAEELATFFKKGRFYLGGLAEKKEIIITPLSLWALKNSNYADLFDKYLENFKKTGDMFNPNGKIFYYMDEFDFNVPNNLSGVTFSIPGEGLFAKIKNFGLGHLLETDFDINKGLKDPLRYLESVGFPKPGGFDGTFEQLVQDAKREYYSKYLPNILDMNPKGLEISRVFPNGEKNKNDKYLPLIKVLRLSNNVYLSSLEAVINK